MKVKTHPPSLLMAERLLWADEEHLKEMLSQCPNYHCRTRQLRPDHASYIDVGIVEIAVCSACYNAWNVWLSQSKLAA